MISVTPSFGFNFTTTVTNSVDVIIQNGSVSTPLLFPQLNSTLPQVTVDVPNCPAAGTTLTLDYTNDGTANFTGVIVPAALPGTCDGFTVSSISVSKIPYGANGQPVAGGAITIIPSSGYYSFSSNGGNPIAIGVTNSSHPHSDVIRVVYNLQQTCAASSTCFDGSHWPFGFSCNTDNCNFSHSLLWGCSNTSLCKTTTTLVTINPTPPAPPALSVTRITPSSASSFGVWDATCSGTETTWQYLIANNSTNACAVAREMVVDLNNAQAANNNSFTHIRQSSIRTSISNNGLFNDYSATLLAAPFTQPANPPSPVTLVDAYGVTIATPNNPELQSLGAGTGASCIQLLGSGEQALSRYVLRIPALEPGQRFILEFSTYRCCPSTALLGGFAGDAGINFNHWQLNVSAKNSCGTLITPSYTGFTQNTVITSNAYPQLLTGPISANLFDDFTTPDLALVQSYTPGTLLLTGGRSSCGPFQNFTITNRLFPSSANSVSNFDLEYMSAGLTNDPDVGLAGACPSGSFTFEIDLGNTNAASIDFGTSSTIVPLARITKGNVTWSSGAWDLSNPTHPRAVFNLQNGWSSSGGSIQPPTTTDDFRRFLVNSDLNFPLRQCCGTGHTFVPAADVFVNTFFTPWFACGATPSCGCQMPLSQQHLNIQLLCPGCITPGVVLGDYTLERTTFGFEDVNDDRIADGQNPAPINTAYVNNHNVNKKASIVGDHLQSVAHGYFQPGDHTDGFDYNDWLTEHANSPLGDLYLEQVFHNGVSVGIGFDNTTVQLLRHNGTAYVQVGNLVTAPTILSGPVGANMKYLCHVTEDDFDPINHTVHFEEQDSFRIVTTYTICNNPTDAGAHHYTELNVDAAMYLTAHAAPVGIYPYTHTSPWGTAGDYFENLAVVPNPPASAIATTDNLVFLCQANAGAMQVYPVKETVEENWDNENSCSNYGYMSYRSAIVGDYQNVFRYEIRPVPTIVDFSV